MNPISIQGRVAILQGVLNNVNVSQNIPKLKTIIRVLHSKQNPLVNVTHLDLILSNDKSQVAYFNQMKEKSKCKEIPIVEEDSMLIEENNNKDSTNYQILKANVKEWLQGKDQHKAMIIENSGYNIMEDQKDIAYLFIRALMQIDLSKSFTQNIAFIDQRVSSLERRVVNFFLMYVEKMIEFTENPFSNFEKGQENAILEKKILTFYEIYNQKYQRTMKENGEISNDFEQIYENYKICKERVGKNHEDYDEFQERNEKTLNILTKKFADLKNNITRVSQEFLTPFKMAICALLYYKLLLDIQLGNEKLKSLYSKCREKRESNNVEESEPLLTNFFYLLTLDFQKLYYCKEAKEELEETFGNEIDIFEEIENGVLQEYKDIYNQMVEFLLKGESENSKDFKGFQAIHFNFLGKLKGIVEEYNQEEFEKKMLEEKMERSEEILKDLDSQQQMLSDSNTSESSLNNLAQELKSEENNNNENFKTSKKFKSAYSFIFGRKIEDDMIKIHGIIE